MIDNISIDQVGFWAASTDIEDDSYKNTYERWLRDWTWLREFDNTASSTAESSSERTEDLESTVRVSRRDSDDDCVLCSTQPGRSLLNNTINPVDLLNLIGREHAGPTSTPADGDCCLHACMGQTLTKGDIKQLREHVARIMDENTHIRKALLYEDRENYLNTVKVRTGHHDMGTMTGMHDLWSLWSLPLLMASGNHLTYRSPDLTA